MPELYPSSTTARAAFHDRNPLANREVVELGAVAPHGQTVRVSETIPAGVKALLDFVYLGIMRRTAAAPVGAYRILFGYNSLVAINLISLDNAVGAVQREAIGNGGFLQATDILQIDTQDTSTGGTVDYSGSYKWTQFDL